MMAGSSHITLPDLKGKVVFITGGSSGIGQGTAVEFAKQGCKVAVHGRDEARLKETVRLCIEAGAKHDQILYVMGDVTIEDQNEASIIKVIQYFGTVHILVNNAGASVVGEGTGLDSHTMEDMLQMLKLHVLAPFHFIKLLKPHLVKNKGSIVCVSSDGAHRPDITMLGYTVGKCGLAGLAKTVALELAADGVRCNVISPCWVRTPFMYNSGFIHDKEEALQYIDKSIDSIPMKYIADPEEIGRMILFLASDCCHYLSGQDILVDGCTSLTSSATYAHLLNMEKL